MIAGVLENIEVNCKCNGLVTEYLTTEDDILLKIHKIGSRNFGSFLKYSSEKFVIIRRLSDVTVKIDVYFYNEKLVSTRYEY